MTRPVAAWLVLAAVAHLAWEVLQLPLYTLYAEGELSTIAFAVAHCTAGDLIISGGTYLAAWACTRSSRWPLERALAGLIAAIGSGVAYTAYSEWLNVYVRGAWAYSQWMPQLLGIGIAPLAQWVVVPLLQVSLLRGRLGSRLMTLP